MNTILFLTTDSAAFSVHSYELLPNPEQSDEKRRSFAAREGKVLSQFFLGLSFCHFGFLFAPTVIWLVW
jgi:hypothetical protein